MLRSGLRVLHLGKYYPPDRGGIETVLESLCRGAGSSIEPRALVLNKSRRTVHETVDGVPVTRVASLATVGAVSLTPSFAWWLRRTGADVIVLHEPNPMALVGYIVGRPRAPLVVWFHSEVIRSRWKYRLLYQPLLDRVLTRAVRIVVASPPMRDVPALAAHADKVSVIPFGLDPEDYRPVSPAPGPDAGPTVLFVGRLVPYKGVDVLIRAMAGVPATLVVVGDGPLRASLEALAQQLGTATSVRFLGHVTDAERLEWYRRADLLALPSVTPQEAFGMVQVEAMLSGRPVVSTALPTGVPWVNRDGETGLVVPPGDVGALSTALSRLCTDRALRCRLGKQARERALQHFTAARMCRAFDDLCHAVAAQRLPAPARSPWNLLAPKRALDVTLSGLGLVVSAPLWGLIALLIKLEDGGPVFYGQERSGLNGRPFHVRKFRSMIPDAEAATGAIQATEHDPRVTRVGRLLRATAMDELPQLWNIFRGDMSFTGPRALRPGEIEVLGDRVELLEEVPGFARRASVRPGLTGVAQIYAARDITRRHKFRYDLLYVRRQSLWLDLRLIALSFWITFRGTWESRDKKF